MYKKRSSKLKSINDFLNITLKKYNLFDKIKEQYIYVVWEEVVGKNISLHAKPTFFQYGRLFVYVDNSTWLNEMKFLKTEIKEKLNKKLGANKIKDIYFKLK
ncbi:MAG: DUF721 domain-containing protein [Candidatus Firestonebacteria bacterium]